MSAARKLSIGAVVAALLGAVVATAALAKIVKNTIDPVAIVTDHGRQIIATGPISCTRGERALLHVTLTQRATGAVAEGRTRAKCRGEGVEQQWEVHASTHGDERFEEGVATAVALARTTRRGASSDAHQWLVEVTLVDD
jgi:hypothetical protein